MKNRLIIKDLFVTIEGMEILHGINMEIEKGKTYALMGPNGSGKSTLANVLMGHPKYKITKGRIILNNEDITHMKPNERAERGIFLSFQQPPEIAGVTLSTFLRTCMNKCGSDISVVDFHNLLKDKMNELNIDPSFIRRSLNEGYSGGEKKKMEILQMMILNPAFSILDETDSGLDVDALKIIADGINKLRKRDLGILLITHYNKMLEYITPDIVHVMHKGRIVKTGKHELAKEIEKDGYDFLKK